MFEVEQGNVQTTCASASVSFSSRYGNLLLHLTVILIQPATALHGHYLTGGKLLSFISASS